ncbi:MAG TPA: hypothetical protein VIS71_11080 [Terrimicrobium sp.]
MSRSLPKAGRVLCRFALAGLVLLSLSSCAWRVVPPAQVTDPVPVYLSEYGRHTRLALPDDSTVFFEYGFGEWNFYGLEKQGVLSALRAISGLGEGALSRRRLSYTLDEAVFLDAAGGNRTVRLWVERSRAHRLREELEARWKANAHVVVVRQADQISVSRDRAAYHVFGNSNHTVAKWLESLGCRVLGYPITSNFKITKGPGAAGHQAPQPRDGETLW